MARKKKEQDQASYEGAASHICGNSSQCFQSSPFPSAEPPSPATASVPRECTLPTRKVKAYDR